MKGLLVALAQSCMTTILTHRSQDDIDDVLVSATNCHLHGDAVGQREPSPNQHVVTAAKHTLE